MSGNSTLLDLRTLLKRKLNAAAGDAFWSPGDLNAYLKEEFETYQRLAASKNAEFGRGSFDLTMPAETTEKDIPLSTIDPASILLVEDRTTYQPGPMVGFAESFEHINAVREQPSRSLHSFSSLCYVERVGDNVRFYLAPKSAESRSIRLHIQIGPIDFVSHDLMHSGLPDYVEKPLVLAAAVTARNQEQNWEAASAMDKELLKARKEMTRGLRSLNRNSPRIRDVYEE